ncbi:MAG: phosphoribosylformylglycinamidine synthase subunit PurS [Acidimicrobiia bacterium]|nr:phosphoribosylformylglycinamidine synthase subunit PurS [Acidimicrobiia bacterium]
MTITRRDEIADPQGAAVERGLRDLGFGDVTGVRINRIIDLTVDDDDEAAVEAQVAEMCQKLLANPVMEDFAISVGTPA